MSASEALQDYSCQQLVELVTKYLEDALTPHERASFEAHLAGCTGCRNYVGQMKATVRALKQPPDPPVAPEVRDNLLDMFRKWRSINGDT